VEKKVGDFPHTDPQKTGNNAWNKNAVLVYICCYLLGIPNLLPA
jgi:hypothetical protein